jgi:hypothetical protein
MASPLPDISRKSRFQSMVPPKPKFVRRSESALGTLDHRVVPHQLEVQSLLATGLSAREQQGSGF